MYQATSALMAKHAKRFNTLRTTIKSQATYPLESVINSLPDPLHVGWTIFGSAQRLQAPIETLFDKFVGNHQKLTKSMKIDKAAFVQDTAKNVLLSIPELFGRRFEDRLQVDGKFSSSSYNGIFEHLYTFLMDLFIPDAASVIKDGGVYPLFDIRHYPDINGMVFTNTPEGKKFMDEYERLRLDGNELDAHIAKHRSHNMAALDKVIKGGVAPSGDQECFIILGTFAARYHGIHNIRMKQLDGTTLSGQTMLLEPDIRHPFVGWIQHIFLVTGPNTVSAVVVGGGQGKVPFLDVLNSCAAPWLWSLVKALSAHNWRLTVGKSLADGDLDAEAVADAVAKATDHLKGQWWVVNLILKGGRFGAWLQAMAGRSGIETMTKQEYIEWRAKDKAEKALTDAEGRGSGRTHHSYIYDSELDRTTIWDKKDDHSSNNSAISNKKPIDSGRVKNEKEGQGKTVDSTKVKPSVTQSKPTQGPNLSNKTSTTLKPTIARDHERDGKVQPKRPASTTSTNKPTQTPASKKQSSNQVTAAQTVQKPTSSGPKTEQSPNSGSSLALSFPGLKTMSLDGFSLTTREMRATTMSNFRTQEAYLALSGERAGGANLEKGPFATTIRERCQAQLNKQKQDVAVRLGSFTAPDTLPVNEFFLKQEIFDQANMVEIVEDGVRATEKILPGLVKDRMDKITDMAKAKKVKIPKELGQEPVTTMLREACLKLLVYPFGDLHNSGFTANAMDEVAARLAIKQLMFEHQKAREELGKIVEKAKAIHGKGDAEAQEKLKVQGLAKQQKMEDIGDMIKEMKERQDRAIKQMKADMSKQTKL